MSHRRAGGNKIPKGWMGCPENGNRIIVNKFIVLKTPLSTHYDRQLPLEARFHPQHIFDWAEKNNVKIGLWIDLTNTQKYFSGDEITSEDCHYEKLPCQGHGQCPTYHFVRSFINIIDSFVRNDPQKCIAVHCTHGFNRTGFLIVAFLVERLRFDVGDAIRLFAQDRPPGIYRYEYIRELYRRYGDLRYLPSPPNTPHWAR